MSSAHLPNAVLLRTQIFIEHPTFAGYCAIPIGEGKKRDTVHAFREPTVQVGRKMCSCIYFTSWRENLILTRKLEILYNWLVNYWQQNYETGRWMNGVRNSRWREHEPKIWNGRWKIILCCLTFTSCFPCCTIRNTFFWVKVLFAVKILCENADTSFWLRYEGMDSLFSRGASKPALSYKKGLDFSIRQFPWCRYSHCGWFQATGTEQELGSNILNGFS